MTRERGVGRPLGGARTDPTGQPAENRTSNQETTTPDPGAHSVTVHALVSRTYNGVRVEVDRDRSFARINLGSLPSWDLVGFVDWKIANAVVGCACIEVVGEDLQALGYVVAELPKALEHAEDWLADSCDRRPGAA
jgi:hypothetical protein